ncbi:MAG: cupredoxin domain-containing protein [Bacillota bacterium]|nr:cupredoxin domain-containing protein [Bacillota bacterium]
MKGNKIIILLLSTVVLLTMSACGSTDLVAKVAVSSFDNLVKAAPNTVTYDKTKDGWTVSGLDCKESIILSSDFSGSNPDIEVEFDAQPFLTAGLDVKKLSGSQYTYNETTGKITMQYEYSEDKFKAADKESILNTFKDIVKTNREIFGYHEEGDHYMIALGNDNAFAWAKDLSKNKTDMAFILNPKPFIDAGVDTGKIKEWVFTKVPFTDKDGKQVWVDRFVKGFNISINTASGKSDTKPQYSRIEGNIQTVAIAVEKEKYAPIVVQKGIPVKFILNADASKLTKCNSTVEIPDYDIKKLLKPGENVIEFTPQKAGTITYKCSMGMIKSSITVVEDIKSKM